MEHNILELYDQIHKLADKIDEKWLKYNYSSDDFYKVVWELTETFDLSLLGDITNQLELLEHPYVRYQQHRSTFSDFHFQIFHNRRFLIEILNWWGSDVNVHDHDFSGVQFQLKGNALNIVYDFTPTETYGALRFGELKVRKAEIWKEGRRSIVRHGALDPHSVSHISKPTTSLLIRTVPTSRYGAQSNYFSTLASHYYVNSDVQRKKLTGLNLLATTSPIEFCKHFKKFIRTQSLSENFFMFLKLSDVVFAEEYVHLVREFAQRGDNESKIISSVAFHKASEFFKIKGNQLCDSEDEKLTIFAIAASQGLENYKKIDADLRISDIYPKPKHLDSFLSKLEGRNKTIGNRYLDLFNITKI